MDTFTIDNMVCRNPIFLKLDTKGDNAGLVLAWTSIKSIKTSFFLMDGLIQFVPSGTLKENNIVGALDSLVVPLNSLRWFTYNKLHLVSTITVSVSRPNFYGSKHRNHRSILIKLPRHQYLAWGYDLNFLFSSVVFLCGCPTFILKNHFALTATSSLSWALWEFYRYSVNSKYEDWKF